jgi:hypothetical protein
MNLLDSFVNAKMTSIVKRRTHMSILGESFFHNVYSGKFTNLHNVYKYARISRIIVPYVMAMLSNFNFLYD